MNTHRKAAATTCALVIIRNATELSPSSRVLSAAAFTSVNDTLSTRFESRSVTMPPGMTRGEAFQHLSRLIPLGATVVMRAPRMRRGLARHLAAGRPMPAPTDAQTLTELRRDIDVRPVAVPRWDLATVGSYFGLLRASPGALAGERVRHCEAEAQALYLAHLFSAVDEHDRVRIAAAFQAWLALRKAAPLGAFGATEEF